MNSTNKKAKINLEVNLRGYISFKGTRLCSLGCIYAAGLVYWVSFKYISLGVFQSPRLWYSEWLSTKRLKFFSWAWANDKSRPPTCGAWIIGRDFTGLMVFTPNSLDGFSFFLSFQTPAFCGQPNKVWFGKSYLLNDGLHRIYLAERKQ